MLQSITQKETYIMSTSQLNQDDFFKEYPTAKINFDAAKISWSILESIYQDYISLSKHLEAAASSTMALLRNIPNIHSVNFRVKDPKHLIEKIIRKKAKNPESIITVENYKVVFEDLIGLRALYLFKDDWEEIHDNIIKEWHIVGNPTANHREGDSKALLEIYEKKGCILKIHDFGYRSTHYIIEIILGKHKFKGEIQVRTLYEEAWSEVDHRVRYPYKIDNLIIGEYSVILNRLSGMADEMVSFIKILTDEQDNVSKAINEKDDTIKNLEDTIRQLQIDEDTKKQLESDIEKLKQNTNEEKIRTAKRIEKYSSINSSAIAKMNTMANIGFPLNRPTLATIARMDSFANLGVPHNTTSFAAITKVNALANLGVPFNTPTVAAIAKMNTFANLGLSLNTPTVAAMTKIATTPSPMESIINKPAILAFANMLTKNSPLESTIKSIPNIDHWKKLIDNGAVKITLPHYIHPY